MTTSSTLSKWKARPIVAAVLRAVAMGSPVVVGYICASLAAASLHPAGRLAWWLAVLGCALAAGWLTFLGTSRLRLLAMLYELDLAFPGRAPERWEVVRRSQSAALVRRKLPGSSTGNPNLDSAAVEILAMSVALPGHDRRSSRHPHRVAAYTDLIANQLRMSEGDRDRLKWAALSHGLGKLLLDRDLLAKPGHLTPKEHAIWETYPAKSMRLIGPMIPWLKDSAGAVAFHTETWDGSGFPDQMSGQEIPISARIVAVAVSFDLLTTGAGAIGHEQARRLIASASGRDFDPQIVRAFLQIPPRSVRGAAGSLVPFVPERPTAFIVRTGPLLALSAAFLVTTAAGVTGALLPLADVTAIDTGALTDLFVSDEVPTTNTSTTVSEPATTTHRTTSTVGGSTTTGDPATTTSPSVHATTTTTRGTTPTRPPTTTTGTTSTSIPSTTTTTPPPTTTTGTTQPPTTTTETTTTSNPTTTTTDTTTTTTDPTTTTTDTTTTTTDPTTTTTGP